MPSDWVKTYDKTGLVAFKSPESRARVNVFSAFAEDGWRSGVSVKDLARISVNLRDNKLGFRIISIFKVSSRVARSRYRYSGGYGYCDITGYGLHILIPNYAIFVRIEMCDDIQRKYDAAFVERVFEGFTY